MRPHFYVGVGVSLHIKLVTLCDTLCVCVCMCVCLCLEASVNNACYLALLGPMVPLVSLL